MRDVILHKLISMNFEDIDSEGLVISFYLKDTFLRPHFILSQGEEESHPD